MASPPKSMSDEDRSALAAKLDQELDVFIDGLEKKRYEDGWPEDRWEEEMAKHPFFMKEAPNPDSTETLSPLAEGLQQLKFDPAENTPIELALNYKEDGNFNFQCKNYRMAIIGYTEGINVKCNKKDINASLYNNRSASHFCLGNFRSSLADSRKALTLQPGHPKALARAAECSLKMSKFEQCLRYCDEMLKEDSKNISAIQIKVSAKKNMKIMERDKRKKNYKIKSHLKEEENIIEAIHTRGIKMEPTDDNCITLSCLEPGFPQIAESRVHWCPTGFDSLVWPLLFLYPQYQTADFVQQCLETNNLNAHISETLRYVPDWDVDRSYRPKNVNVYYEGTGKNKLFQADPQKSLLDIMKEPTFELRGGTPAFLILPKDSPFEKHFVDGYK